MSDEGKLINYMDIYYIFSRAEKNSYLKGSVWLDMVLKGTVKESQVLNDTYKTSI